MSQSCYSSWQTFSYSWKSKMALFFSFVNYRVSIESKARGVKEKWLMPIWADADFLPAAFHSEVTLHRWTPYQHFRHATFMEVVISSKWTEDCSMSLKLSLLIGLNLFLPSQIPYYIITSLLHFSTPSFILFQISEASQEEEQSTPQPPQKITENI